MGYYGQYGSDTNFVRGVYTAYSGKYTFLEASAYLICDARTKGWLSITSRINRGSHKVCIRAILTVVTQAWSSLGRFEKLIFKISNDFESLSKILRFYSLPILACSSYLTPVEFEKG